MAISFDECRGKLIAAVKQIVEESGHAENFEAEVWVDHWLNEPLPALGGTPRDYLLAKHDCDQVVRLLLQTQSGSFA